MENLGCPNMLGTNLSPAESGVSMALRGSPQILDDSLEPLARGSCWSCDVEPGIGPLAQACLLDTKEELGLPSLSTAGSSRRQCWSQELDQLRERQAQLKEQLCACAQELGVVRRHEQRLQEANKELQEQLRVQEAKVEQLRSTLATRGAHQGQELRRREQELGRLKDRLGQVMMDKRDRRTNMDILNPLSRANGRRATWKTGKALGKREEELYRSLLGTQEKQMAVLAVENAELQLALEQLGHDFQGLLPPGQDGDPKLDSTHLADVIWELWGCLKARVEALGSWAVAGAPPGLGGADGELPVISVTDHDKEIARLRAEIEESRSLIAWQQQCLQRQQFEAERALLLKHQFLSAAANLDLWGPQRQESAPSTTWVLDQEPHPQAKKRPQPSYSPFLVPETSAMPFRSQLLHPQPASTPCLGEQCWGQCLILHYSPATPAQPRLLDAAWKGGHQDRASQTQSEDLWPVSTDLLGHFLEASF
ncbi:afadin- and alpha-actinin-binding protein isoform X4 [Alligator mississippiensis]|uniref:afadin- and alpha-actinin-binding protein isoform X4 n=1 Tax=Alligator mississippiensis TaxID=8496 RepID=UPI002877E4EC|nr:afadin- and alpha-actinin-binding protein isoform X4 [Alligator mississippiensis]